MSVTLQTTAVPEIDKSNITPYLSVLIIKKDGDKTDVENHRHIFDKVKVSTKDDFVEGATISDNVGELGNVNYTVYNLLSTPSWTNSSEALDLERHVFITLFKGEYVALYFSKKGMKDHVREIIESGLIENVQFVDSSIFNQSFVNEDKINMLWLAGTHGREAYKADSKVLGGGGVVDTLDPILDQSYVMSAARTEVDMDSKGVSIGINPSKSSIWRGPCATWDDFEARVFNILDIIEQCSESTDNPISFLSYPVSDCSGLNKPYDFVVADPEFVPDSLSVAKKSMLYKIWSSYRTELQDSLTGDDIWLDVFHDNILIGDVKVRVSIRRRRAVFEVIKKNEKSGDKSKLADFLRVFSHPELVKVWFESGHAVVNGMVYKTGYTDVAYDQFIWSDFSNYKVDKEKPGKIKTKPDLSRIGHEDSLFCWVKKKWTGSWEYPQDYGVRGFGKGWLYCDDGSGEKADFIHFVEFEGSKYITLIHVKSASTCSIKRKISVGAHDVVLGQAVKNIRYCRRKNLVKDLKKREANAENKHCWLDGDKKEPRLFIEELEKIPDDKTLKIRVVVVQPHTLKKCYESTTSNIKSQLDVLLVSAQTAIRSAGSEFYIIGAMD